MKSGLRTAPGWPTYSQELLLRACLLKNETAIRAWHEWKACVRIDALDDGSRRLLPLLYHNLAARATDDPLMGILKGLYRRTWFLNQRIVHSMALRLAEFEEAGIPTIVLKGGALAFSYYKDPGLRPMDDVDVLVPSQLVQDAIDLLHKKGFRSGKGRNFTAAYRTVRSSHNFVNDAGEKLDLHWHALMECNSDGADDDFWNAAVPCEIPGGMTRALAPADQLLHVCVHGLCWNPASSLRWVPDAYAVLQSSKVDWRRLSEQAQKRRLTVPVYEALRYVSDLLEAPVPQTALDAIGASGAAKIQYLEFKSKMSPPALFDRLPALWYRYVLFSKYGDGTLLKKVLMFPRYIQHTLEFNHLWDLVVYLFLRIWARREGYVKFWRFYS